MTNGRRSLAALFVSVFITAVVAGSSQQPAARPTGAVRSVFVVAVRTTPETDVIKPCLQALPAGSDYAKQLEQWYPGYDLVPADGNWLPGGVPDPDSKAAIERELSKSGKYLPASSPAEADLVFFLQTTWRADTPEQPTSTDLSLGLSRALVNPRDEKPTRFGAQVAIVAPADVYRRDPADSGALLRAAIWGRKVGSCEPGKGRRVRPEFLADGFVQENRLRPVGDASSPPHPRRAPVAQAQAARGDAVGAVPVQVTDAKGAPVSGLSAFDFKVFEDDVQQQLQLRAPGAEPVNVAFLLDSSVSMMRATARARNAAAALFNMLPPADRIMTVSFESRIRLLGSWTSEREAVRGLWKMMLNGGDTTRLYDAMAATLDRLDATAGRKAMVIVTDGMDNGSGFADHAAILARLQGSNVAVSVIQTDTTPTGVTRPISVPSRGRISSGNLSKLIESEKAEFRQATAGLQALTQATGGRFEPVTLEDVIADRVARIVKELQTGYVLSYTPAAKPGDGRVRRIRVEVARPDVTVRSRTDYKPRQM